MKKIFIFDSTLRDGAQSEGISFSVQDKVNIASVLDELGVDYIEAGNPGSNPKDMEFFSIMNKRPLRNAKITAFGSTRRKTIKASEDPNIISLIKAETPCVTIFGKTWDMHVTDIIHTALEENIEMIKDTVSYLKQKGKEVIFDAEHFFDGYKANQEFAMDCLKAAEESGADSICLCDTNGGCFPDEVFEITKTVCDSLNIPVGIHTHNDSGMAVANSIMAVKAGAECIQGTIAGFGERCGNANLSTIIASLQLKGRYLCIPRENMSKLTDTVRTVAEISNISLEAGMPYVGKKSFTHKGGMHVDGVMKNPASFEHVSPNEVGNERKILMSEVAGKSALIEKVRKFLPSLEKNSEQASFIVDTVKKMEHQGYQFEGAESSFELLVMKLMGIFKPHFEIEQLKVTEDNALKEEEPFSASALIKVRVGDKTEITAAEGDGPVNAIDIALRKALEIFFPQISGIHLTDYKVRVLDSQSATAAKVRVLIESTDGQDYWTTVGVSTDIIKASTIALIDSIEYNMWREAL